MLAKSQGIMLRISARSGGCGENEDLSRIFEMLPVFTTPRMIPAGCAPQENSKTSLLTLNFDY